jgi:hypothetical protein
LAFQKFHEVAKIKTNLRNIIIIIIIIIIIPQILLGDEMEREEGKCIQGFGGERQRERLH